MFIINKNNKHNKQNNTSLQSLADSTLNNNFVSSKMCSILLIISFGFIIQSSMDVMVDGASRQPNIRDHLHCKMEFLEQWEEVMQTADPYSVVEAYYVSIIIIFTSKLIILYIETNRKPYLIQE